jgi:hypothetical protein
LSSELLTSLPACLCCPALTAAGGIRAIAKQEEPVGRLLSRLEMAEGLVLDKVGVQGARTSSWQWGRQ